MNAVVAGASHSFGITGSHPVTVTAITWFADETGRHDDVVPGLASILRGAMFAVVAHAGLARSVTNPHPVTVATIAWFTNHSGWH
jgi:hypothetical protein